ncbi:hypothetical protein I3843_02G169700 [Carya illinoinensis]|nr:hypothetical protein I3843_02G169700 [Carya illinoinensis]
MALRNTIFFTFFLIASLIALLTPFTTSQNANVSAIFIFGDSTIDPSNNNHINTLFHSDHPPYGIDFPGRVPTRKFCDGKLVTDFLISSLGIKELLPAYFVSVGSSLDLQTIIITQALDLPTHLNKFYEALQRMEGVVGQEEVRRIVKNALFLISFGSNDMLFNYYDIPTRALDCSLPGYHQMQLQTMYGFIENLYKLGARRIAVAGLPPIGCVPAQVTIGSILPISTNFIQRSSYNQQLKALTSSWQSKLQSSRIVYADIYSPIMDMIQNPNNNACRGTGLAEAGPLCQDASKYIFFDSVHLTEAAYRAIADIVEK